MNEMKALIDDMEWKTEKCIQLVLPHDTKNSVSGVRKQ